MWSALATDLGGVVLFLIWLVLPPLYTVVIGRHYARQCRESAEIAVLTCDDLRNVHDSLTDLEGSLTALLHDTKGTP
ncbi:hypothetical protein SUDANB95_05611 [Actinosynnema sp. ALI-1.44]|uniref:Uncharacterized protein n=1 Tax=Saccharothrix mutabilis subsp. mutabilis TaxID=66855 RepID=A0ABN0U961_9PSEU